MSAITYERYTPSGFVEIVNIGDALSSTEGGIANVNLTHMPIKSEFAIRFAGSDDALQKVASIVRYGAV